MSKLYPQVLEEEEGGEGGEERGGGGTGDGESESSISTFAS